MDERGLRSIADASALQFINSLMEKLFLEELLSDIPTFISQLSPYLSHFLYQWLLCSATQRHVGQGVAFCLCHPMFALAAGQYLFPNLS